MRNITRHSLRVKPFPTLARIGISVRLFVEIPDPEEEMQK